jgi:hypothetical protein
VNVELENISNNSSNILEVDDVNVELENISNNSSNILENDNL